ncbi:unnamed protein product [Cylicocyclus nassatus]|uniref:CPL domain-containing protein n=1 Tax=Cylicocyclus nassatus TaxID=53992 RepID=A0AA36DNV8_CYLNA|nr:unnamed protein product [Cylicocyclus nassatus]
MLRDEIELLKKGDANPFSKKEKKDRYAEIYRHICESLYAYLADNMESLIFEHNRSKFVAASLEITSDYDLFDRQVPLEMRKHCNEAIAQLAKQELGSWICCNKGCHVLLKMIQCGADIVRQKVKEAVNMKQLKEYTFKGAMLLVQEIAKS